jgi:hypothetical protein
MGLTFFNLSRKGMKKRSPLCATLTGLPNRSTIAQCDCGIILQNIIMMFSLSPVVSIAGKEKGRNPVPHSWEALEKPCLNTKRAHPMGASTLAGSDCEIFQVSQGLISYCAKIP